MPDTSPDEPTTQFEDEMREQDNPDETKISDFAKKFGEPHDFYVQQYLDGKIDAVELISELEFDNFDGDVFDVL